MISKCNRAPMASILLIAAILAAMEAALRADPAAPTRPIASPPPATQPTPAEQRLVRAIQCTDNLHKIYIALASYSFDHNEKYPPNLGEALIAAKLPMAVFLCPDAPSALPERWRTLTPEQQAEWVNAHADYVYLAAGRSNVAKSDQPLLYDKDDDHPGVGMHVLYGDGHIDLLRLDEVHQRLGPKAGGERVTTRVTLAAGQPPVTPMITLDQAKARVAQLQMQSLEGALDLFEIDNGRYPTSEEGLSVLVQRPASGLPTWHGPYINRLPGDPWGHPFIYVSPGQGRLPFSVTSSGPDGKPGTADDIKKD